MPPPDFLTPVQIQFIPKDFSLGYSKQQVGARGERGYIPEFRPKNLDFRDDLYNLIYKLYNCTSQQNTPKYTKKNFACGATRSTQQNTPKFLSPAARQDLHNKIPPKTFLKTTPAIQLGWEFSPVFGFPPLTSSFVFPKGTQLKMTSLRGRYYCTVTLKNPSTKLIFVRS